MELSGEINFEAYKFTDSQVTEVVVSALLCVYESTAELEPQDIATKVSTESNFAYETRLQIINKMIEGENPLLMVSWNPQYKTVFGVAGLWLLEDCFMNGEDAIDGMVNAENTLTKRKFF